MAVNAKVWISKKANVKSKNVKSKLIGTSGQHGQRAQNRVIEVHNLALESVLKIKPVRESTTKQMIVILNDAVSSNDIIFQSFKIFFKLNGSPGRNGVAAQNHVVVEP